LGVNETSASRRSAPACAGHPTPLGKVAQAAADLGAIDVRAGSKRIDRRGREHAQHEDHARLDDGDVERSPGIEFELPLQATLSLAARSATLVS
jgi:hypothetical protein